MELERMAKALEKAQVVATAASCEKEDALKALREARDASTRHMILSLGHPGSDGTPLTLNLKWRSKHNEIRWKRSS